MNAMKKKMPDKLFSWTSVLGSFYASPRKPEEVNAEEYLRKDALLEWAKEKNQEINTDKGDYSLGYVSAMIDLIDKIESL